MKKLLISLVLALVLLFSMSSVASADSPTDVNVSWGGSGVVSGDITAGDDATAGFVTAGDAISGSYTATDSNNNPYGYNVDSFSTYFIGSVANGFINTGANRNDSYSPMYGAAGQTSWSIVDTDGTASMAYRSTTNYASMVDGSYGYQLPGGHNIAVAGATSYLIDRGIDNGGGESGWVFATGDGSAILDSMVSTANGGSVQFGRGGGCYTDANFNATGTGGYFEVEGAGDNNITFNGMGVSSGGGALSLVANWLNNFSIGDYSLTAN